MNTSPTAKPTGVRPGPGAFEAPKAADPEAQLVVCKFKDPEQTSRTSGLNRAKSLTLMFFC